MSAPYKVEEANGFCTVTILKDRLECGGNELFFGLLDMAVEGRRMLLDFSNVQYMHTDFTGFLTKLIDWFSQAGGSLAACSFQDQPKEKLRIMRMDRVLVIHDNKESCPWMV